MTYVPDSIRATIEDPGLSPEQRLWLAVLACAARDIGRGDQYADAAKRWICVRDQDTGFRRCCELANVDPDAFRRDIVRYITREHGQWVDPATLDEVLLSGRGFHVAQLGHPAHLVVERMQELIDKGIEFHRMAMPGTYQRSGVNKPSTVNAKLPPQCNHTHVEADQIILSGNEFDAGPDHSRIRSRITVLRKKGYIIPSLGHRKFRCENPDKSFTSA